MKLFATTLLTLFLGVTTTACAQEETQPPANKAEVEAIVADYIAHNGAAILDAIDRYQNELQMQAFKDAIKEHNAVRGAADAPVTIVEFGEFECPFCKRVQPTVEQILADYDGQVRHVYKHYTLPFHSNAVPAAQAAQAAHLQGKFWEFSELLWERTDRLSEATYAEIADEIGLDVPQFNADRNSNRVAELVAMDQQDAAAAGARGTPYFLINGTPVSGAQPYEAFKQAIDAALTAAEAQ